MCYFIGLFYCIQTIHQDYTYDLGDFLHLGMADNLYNRCATIEIYEGIAIQVVPKSVNDVDLHRTNPFRNSLKKTKTDFYFCSIGH